MINLLTDLIKIKSDNLEGANEALQYCKNWLEKRGVITKTYELNNKQMLVAEIGTGEETIIWNGHIDVVPGNPEQFEPKIVEDRLYGRGSADMKAGVAAMMEAFAVLSEKQELLTKKVQLHIATDEETGGKTSKHLVEQGYHGDFVICGEPTHVNIGLQAKGILQWDVHLKGKSAHGSRPWEGVNAIEKAMLFDQDLRKCSFMQASNEYYEYPSLNLAKIEGGDRYNMVPDECIISYSLRFVPGQDVEEISKELRSLLEKYPGSEIHFQGHTPAITNKEDDKYIQKLLATCNAIRQTPTTLFGQHGAADTRYYAAKGAVAIEFGPSGSDWHGDQESVSISSVEEYKDILVKFVLD
ncbi:MAG: ArgE/DapE family deacylase [Psychrobacillus sp.]|uniref:M20 family metallopeptidase n=1 Tax=Psychrobacillus sp. MER TA 171 TaxID=2939577 RepID=UPI00204120E9|nr:ArgE/DapE family deacylase [Psychrobacillus sp. MER TA 171]MCM3360059.1 ArgE/DapE family deacylase [Psychrobacillus sp. MER TA 171]